VTGEAARRRAGWSGRLAAAALALVLGFASGAAPAAARGLQATMAPAEIPLGESAELRIVLPDDAVGQPELPRVEGLRFARRGTSSEIRIVNGRISRTVSLVFEVTPSRTGEFEIPPVEVASEDGDPLSTAPLALRVVQPAPAPRTAAPPASSSPEGAARRPRLVMLGLPDALWVGELARVEVQLRVPAGTRIAELSPPDLSAAGFTVTEWVDREPRVTLAEVEGVPMTLYTWHAAVAPVKPGRQELEAEVEGVRVVREPRSARFPRGWADELFPDSLLERFFGDGGLDHLLAFGRRVPFAAASDVREIEVRPLPAEGRPEDFSGAVGRFELESEADPTRVDSGEPVTLTVRVVGDGNFDRVTLDGVTDADGFRTYAARGEFRGDALGSSGRKVFEQLLVPEHAGADAVPPVRFSFFDPEARAYRSLETPPIPLAVAAAPSPSPADGGAEPAATTPLAADAELRTDPARLAPLALPLLARPGFWTGLAALAAAPLLLWLALRGSARRRDAGRAAQRAAREALRARLQELEAAADRGDATAFHESARRALRAALAVRLEQDLPALTPAEAEVRLGDDPELAAGVRRALEQSEQVAWSGVRAPVGSLARQRGTVLALVRRLEAA